MESKSTVTRESGYLSQNADLHEAIHEVVRPCWRDAEPLPQARDVDNGVIEQLVHHSIPVGGSAAETICDPIPIGLTHAQDPRGRFRRLAAHLDDALEEECKPWLPLARAPDRL